MKPYMKPKPSKKPSKKLPWVPIPAPNPASKLNVFSKLGQYAEAQAARNKKAQAKAEPETLTKLSFGTKEGAAKLNKLREEATAIQYGKKVTDIPGTFLSEHLEKCTVVLFEGGAYYREYDSWDEGSWMPVLGCGVKKVTCISEEGSISAKLGLPLKATIGHPTFTSFGWSAAALAIFVPMRAAKQEEISNLKRDLALASAKLENLDILIADLERNNDLDGSRRT